MTAKVAIITSGYFPVPASKGGAVEALVQNLINENELQKNMKFVIFSCFDKQAFGQASKYKQSIFHFIKTPLLIRWLDFLIYHIFKNILHVDKSMSYRYILQRLHYINKVAKFLKNNNYSRVVLENHPTLFMVLKKYNNEKKYQGKYYYHLHNVVSNAYGCDEQIKNSTRVLGVSEYVNQTLRDMLSDQKSDKYVVLKNKVNRDKFAIKLSKAKIDMLKEGYGILPQCKVILFSGRLNEEKGIKQLLQAWQKMDHNKATLLIVGSYYYGSGMQSDFEKEIYSLAGSMNDSVKFTGFVPYEKIPSLLQIADVVALPSIWDDPAPLTVIEALTACKPVITTDSGGIPEYAGREDSIILQRSQHLVTELRDSLRFLIDSSEKRKKMSQAAGRKTANWTIAQYYIDFCNFLGVN